MRTRAAIEKYLNTPGPQRAQATIELGTRSAIRWVTAFGDRRIASLSLGDLEAYLMERQAAGWAPMTLRREVAFLRRFARWAITHGFIDKDPTVGLPIYPSRALRSAHALRAPEVAALLDACRNPYTCRVQRDGRAWELNQFPPHWLYPVTLCAVRTLLRISTVIHLQWSHVDWAGRRLQVPADLMKMRRSISIPVAGDLWDWFVAHRGAPDQTCFGAPDRVVVWKSYKLAAARAGIPQVTIHDLRKTGATYLLEQGVPLNVVQRLGGWSKPAVLLEYYAQVHDDALETAAQRLGQLGK